MVKITGAIEDALEEMTAVEMPTNDEVYNAIDSLRSPLFGIHLNEELMAAGDLDERRIAEMRDTVLPGVDSIISDLKNNVSYYLSDHLPALQEKQMEIRSQIELLQEIHGSSAIRNIGIGFEEWQGDAGPIARKSFTKDLRQAVSNHLSSYVTLFYFVEAEIESQRALRIGYVSAINNAIEAIRVYTPLSEVLEPIATGLSIGSRVTVKMPQLSLILGAAALSVQAGADFADTKEIELSSPDNLDTFAALWDELRSKLSNILIETKEARDFVINEADGAISTIGRGIDAYPRLWTPGVDFEIS